MATVIEAKSAVIETYPYEFHVTVNAERIDVDKYRAACRDIGVKPIVLDLEVNSGTPFRDVMTSSKMHGSDHEAYTTLNGIAAALTARGYSVVRRKIETSPWHPGAPSTDNGIEMPGGSYFESHFGVLLRPEDKPFLRSVIDKSKLRHPLHLSSNAFKQEGDEITVMATARSYEGTVEEFTDNVAAHFGYLSQHFRVEDPIVEFALFDSSTHHDDAWLAL